MATNIPHGWAGHRKRRVSTSKNLSQTLLLGKKTYGRFCKLGWSATWVSYSRLVSRQPLAPSQALEGGLAGA